jgi:hypothetical protein
MLERLLILHRIPRGLLRGFCALIKSVPEGAKFRNTPSACGGDRNFEDFVNLLTVEAIKNKVKSQNLEIFWMVI